MQRRQPLYDNGIEYWQCSICKAWLPASDFYSDKRRWNNLKSQCKKCHMKTVADTQDKNNHRRINREHMRRAKHINPEKFRIRGIVQSKKQRMKNKIKIRSRDILDKAVLRSKIIKPSNCSECGKIRKLTAHHDDYNKPLVVRWLCHECHGKQTVKDNIHRDRNLERPEYQSQPKVRGCYEKCDLRN